MIVGETVVVERRTQVGVDPGNNAVFEWAPESVDDVLVAPGARADVVESVRPAGVDVRYTLHFPKGYPATLRGARVRVRGQEPLAVVGDPDHYIAANTPTRWSMPVEVGRVDG